MIAYHFTSRQFFPKIMLEGVTKCGVPWKPKGDGPVPMMRGLQWLTLAGDFDDQTWHEPQLFAPHRMRKIDYRLTVKIPSLASHLVVPWTDFARHHSLPVAQYFENFPDSKWWLILRGQVPRSWLAESLRNPTLYSVPELISGGE